MKEVITMAPVATIKVHGDVAGPVASTRKATGSKAPVGILIAGVGGINNVWVGLLVRRPTFL
jgi:hypothetical protein